MTIEHKGICLACGIDTIVLNVYGVLRDEKEIFLKRLKQQAIDTGEAVVDIESIGFCVLPHGKSGFGFLLVASEMKVCLSAGQHAGYPRMQLYFHSHFLWQKGAWEAIEKGIQIAHFFLEGITKIQPSRVDLASDFGGTTFQLSDLDKIVTRASSRSFYLFQGSQNGAEREEKATSTSADEIVGHMQGRRFTGFRLGRGKILARIYDKGQELMNNPHKREIMEAIYGYPIATTNEIWRVEFQMRREALRDLAVDSLEDLQGSTKDMWDYLTKKWLVLKRKNNSKQPTRWATDERWRTVQDAFSLAETAPPAQQRCTENQEFYRIKALGQQIIGCLTTVGAYEKMNLVELNEWVSQLLVESLNEKSYEKQLRKKVGRVPINLETIKSLINR